jgi:hypothetical protein
VSDEWINGKMDGRRLAPESNNPLIHESNLKNESSRISKEALRKLQNHPAQRRHSGYLQQQTPQATARIILWHVSLV